MLLARIHFISSINLLFIRSLISHMILLSYYQPFHSNDIITSLHASFSANTMLHCETKYTLEQNLAYSQSHPSYKLNCIMLCSDTHTSFRFPMKSPPPKLKPRHGCLCVVKLCKLLQCLLWFKMGLRDSRNPKFEIALLVESNKICIYIHFTLGRQANPKAHEAIDLLANFMSRHLNSSGPHSSPPTHLKNCLAICAWQLERVSYDTWC